MEKLRSRVLRKALAASGVDATTMLHVPILSCITGPYCFESLARVTCGILPSIGSAPSSGQPFGPGGRGGCCFDFDGGFDRINGLIVDRIRNVVRKKRMHDIASSLRRIVSKSIAIAVLCGK